MAVGMLLPLFAQSEEEARGAASPKTGVRFVVCSASGASLPDPLFIQQGKTIRQLSIRSRTPSQRVRPVAGKFDFYDKDPSAAMMDNGKGAGAPQMPPDMKPALSLPAPETLGGKQMGIVFPAEDVSKSRCLYLNESDFPVRGVHIVNLSPRPLRISTSLTGDYKDKKVSPIGAYRRDEGLNGKNAWHFSAAGKEAVFMMLEAKEEGKDAYRRFKASRMTFYPGTSDLIFIVMNPATKKLQTISVRMPKD